MNNLKGNTLVAQTWFYLALFSFGILGFVWLFQIVFLNSFYEWNKTNKMHTLAKKITIDYKKGEYQSLGELSYLNEICIEVVFNNNTIYSTSNFSKGCINDNSSISYKKDFIASNKDYKTYKLVNKFFNNNSIIIAQKIEDNKYMYISSSLVPLNSTTAILTKQFAYVSVGVLLLSFLIAYLISKKLTGPIISLNKAAKNLGKSNSLEFPTDSDIIELNELAKTLNTAKEELSKTELLRRELLANVSHDLKTPLTMIQAYAEMARDLNSDNKEKRVTNLNIIIEEAKRLNLLVNDVVDLSRMQANFDVLEYSSFCINNLVNTIIEHYNYLEKDGYKVRLIAKEKMYVQADYKRIEQALYNLINNAINYTGEDRIIIIKLSKLNKHILVEIIDHGKGIKKEDLPLIWDKYYKVDRKYSRNKIGTGIGLSIVKNIFERHNLKYGVKSTLNKGTTFYFELEKDYNK